MTAPSITAARSQYRLQIATLAVYWSGSKGQHLHIPAGALLERPRGSEACSPFVEVLWNDRRLRMFAEDFEHRTEPV